MSLHFESPAFAASSTACWGVSFPCNPRASGTQRGSAYSQVSEGVVGTGYFDAEQTALRHLDTLLVSLWIMVADVRDLLLLADKSRCPKRQVSKPAPLAGTVVTVRLPFRHAARQHIKGGAVTTQRPNAVSRERQHLAGIEH